MFGSFGIIAPHPPILIPAVGGARSEVTCASAAALRRAGVALSAFAPDTIVVMSPHAPSSASMFLVDGATEFTGSMVTFGDPRVSRHPGDPDLAYRVLSALAARGIPSEARASVPASQPGSLDHGCLVPLESLGVRDVPLVVLSLSDLPYLTHRELGATIAFAAHSSGKRVAFLASGDLSHRLTRDAPAGYAPEAAELDRRIVDAVAAGTLGALCDLDPDLIEAGGECGLRSIITLGGFLGHDPLPSRVLSYEGPWGVGYLTALAGESALAHDQQEDVGAEPVAESFADTPATRSAEIVSLARASIISHVTGVPAPPVHLDGVEYPCTAGAFVSLHRAGELRGCIGTIGPTKDTLAEEVAHNAVEAAVHDPRFPPLQSDELEDLDVKVDVLEAPEPCTVDGLDPHEYGVIVSSGWRRGLLLPDLDGVDDVPTQVSIALRKAGIDSDEPYSVERFRVHRYI